MSFLGKQLHERSRTHVYILVQVLAYQATEVASRRRLAVALAGVKAELAI